MAGEPVPFELRQPGYLKALMEPASLDGYEPKWSGKDGYKFSWIPPWMDYWLFGPPVIRDSSPGVMAMIFGRTEHDKEWNPKPKGPLQMSFNNLCLIFMYILFMYVPFHGCSSEDSCHTTIHPPSRRWTWTASMVSCAHVTPAASARARSTVCQRRNRNSACSSAR